MAKSGMCEAELTRYQRDKWPGPFVEQGSPDQSMRPLDREHLIARQLDRPQSTPYAEDVLLSKPEPLEESSMEGLAKLGQDVNVRKEDFWRRWNNNSVGGIDIDRIYKLKTGEFSPMLAASRIRGRGSRSPDASAQREVSQPIAPGDEATGGSRSPLKARHASPWDKRDGKHRQSWREEINKTDANLLGRSDRMAPSKAALQKAKIQAEPFGHIPAKPALQSGISQVSRTVSADLAIPQLSAAAMSTVPSSFAGSFSAAPGMSVSTAAGSVMGLSTAGASSMADVSSSASTAAVSPMLLSRGLYGENAGAGRKKWQPTPPSKNRVLGAPDAGSSPQTRSRRLRSGESGASSDFWA